MPIPPGPGSVQALGGDSRKPVYPLIRKTLRLAAEQEEKVIAARIQGLIQRIDKGRATILGHHLALGRHGGYSH